MQQSYNFSYCYLDTQKILIIRNFSGKWLCCENNPIRQSDIVCHHVPTNIVIDYKARNKTKKSSVIHGFFNQNWQRKNTFSSTSPLIFCRVKLEIIVAA